MLKTVALILSLTVLPSLALAQAHHTRSAQYDLHFCPNDRLACCTVCMNAYGYCNGGHPSAANFCERQFNDCIIFQCKVSCPGNRCMVFSTPPIPFYMLFTSRRQASHGALSKNYAREPSVQVK